MAMRMHAVLLIATLPRGACSGTLLNGGGESWSISRVALETVQGGATKCYIALFDGPSCSAAGAAGSGGVYLISPDW